MMGGTITRATLAIGAALLVASCGDDDGGGTLDPADGGMLVEQDAGPVSCVADMDDAASTVGCNGGFQGAPAANEPGGTCELGTDEEPAGSCTTELAICMGDFAATGQGWCVPGCQPPATFVDQQTCPTGWRCFRNGTGEDAFGLCYRDCDGDHPCQEGWACNDAFGRCEQVLTP